MLSSKNAQIALAGAAAGAAGVAVAGWLLQRLAGRGDGSQSKQGVSTTSSSHDQSVYETSKAVDEYLMFHYDSVLGDYMPYTQGPRKDLDFCKRTADIAVALFRKHNPGATRVRALDVGCAVGRSCFSFSEACYEVVGIDFSHAFVRAAETMRTVGEIPYKYTIEGEIQGSGCARRPAAGDAARIRFEQGDACDLDELRLGRFQIIHGANLLCRLPDPDKFLDSLPRMLAPGGVVVLPSPYSWLPAYTERSKWVGGRVEDGTPCPSFENLKAKMEARGLQLVHREDTPFVIREHARKFQWGCSDLTAWMRRPDGAAAGAGAGGQ